MPNKNRIASYFYRAVLTAGLGLGSSWAQPLLHGLEIGQGNDTGAVSATYKMPSIRIGAGLEGSTESQSYRLNLLPLNSVPFPPVIVITSPVNDTLTNVPAIRIGYTVDGFAAAKIFTLSEGLNEIIVDSVDAYGGRGADTVHATLDTQPPVVTIQAPSNDTIVRTPTILIQFTVDGEPRTKSVSLQEGLNQVLIDSADAAGNHGSDILTVTLDATGPRIAIISPQNGAAFSELNVLLKAALHDSLGYDPATLQVSLDGKNVLPSVEFSGDTLSGLFSLGEGTHFISISVADLIGNVTVKVSHFSAYLPEPAIVISSPENLLTVHNADILVEGHITRPVTQILAAGVPAILNGTHFQAVVPLVDGRNTLIVTALDGNGEMVSDAVTVTLDREKPRIYISTPRDSLRTSQSTLTVTGAVSDRIADAQNQSMPIVKVNGVLSEVANNTFAASISIAQGWNTLTCVATDKAGNSESAVLHVFRETNAMEHLEILSGQGQSATVLSTAPQSFKVVYKDGNGVPQSGKTVLFRVTLGDGVLNGQKRLISVLTDASGVAEADFTLGKRSGPGANEVTVSSPPLLSEVVFLAEGLPLADRYILTSSGDMQRGLTSAKASQPLVAIVMDGKSNPIEGEIVRFKVKSGGGSFDGVDILIAVTGADGRATAEFTLGSRPGRDNNIVEADFIGNTGRTAVFVISGYEPGLLSNTSVSGVVLDNSNLPLPGVTVRIEGSGQQASTDENGKFSIAGAPIGRLHLFVDGSTSTRPGDWVTLMFEVNSISGQDNDLGMPIYLVSRNNSEGKIASASVDQVMTLSEIPGFSLRIPAGSAIFPPDMDDHTISVTQVHTDKIPMPPGDGMQPRFIISIGPPQVKFDPPAPITFPNVDGLKPGEQTHFYSFDHDLGTYVSIGTGTVSDDGTVVTSDKGFGIVKGGWHCEGPSAPTGDCESGDCDVTASLVGESVVPVGSSLSFKASGKPGGGSYSWSSGEQGSSAQMACNNGGDLADNVTYTCKSGESATALAEGTCLEVTGITPGSCNLFELRQPLNKNDFNIFTNPPDMFWHKSVIMKPSSAQGSVSSFTGLGTGTVSVSAGTSFATTPVNIIDPNWSRKESFVGWDLNTIKEYLGTKKSGGACSPNFSTSFEVTHSKKKCDCEAKSILRVGGLASIGLVGCEQSIPIFISGPAVSVSVIIPYGISIDLTADVGTTCTENNMCLAVSGTGSLGLGANVCVGTCSIFETRLVGTGSLTISGGEICTETGFSPPHFNAPTLAVTGEVLLAGGQLFGFEQTVELSQYFH